ncbi:hypothetical protein V8E51_010276 [Hyaloscypha variabilis]
MGKTLFQSKKTSKKPKHPKHRATTKKSHANDDSSNPEEKHPSSMTAPASTNSPTFRDETNSPYAHAQTSTTDPYFQASVQQPQTVSMPPHQSNSYPSVQATNYSSVPYAANYNYTSSTTYYQQMYQANDSSAARQPSLTDVFHTHGESYADSFTTPEYPTEAEDPTDQFRQRSPQLQIWAEETSDMNLPVNERLVRSNWE